MLVFEDEIGDVAGFTVILPAVSVGNAGQLCVDVLLENIQKEKMKTFQVLHPSLVPVVAPDTLLENTSVSTALQAYVIEDSKLVIFQIRSGILPGQGSAFIADFLKWFKESGCAELVVVGSMHAHERIDKQITGTDLRYLTSLKRKVPDDFVKLEHREQDLETGGEPNIPGGGISSRILRQCHQQNLAATVLIKFCSEGDNSTDGMVLAQYLNLLVPVFNKSRPKIPKSWQHLFGHSAPVQMFW
eukprot:TRINITY_DN3084_c0_g1_i6.p1 TRINITY_DN3084_c0_g1~~TRINITY_DN3084_c0_g1_i6.p1  ORF type:complete len:244 (-),score=45.68 TRINITY_DN3084_c0_g1_i6:308-1039(-)